MDLQTSLLGVVTLLVGCMVWIVKAQHNMLVSTLTSLQNAVNAFGRFEESENDIHTKIIERLDRGLEISDAIKQQLQRLSCNEGDK